MSAVAQLLQGAGHRVTGSDRFLDQGDRLAVLDQLERSGIQLVPQDGSGVGPDTASVVVSTAIEDDNPDLVRAGALGVPRVHRAEMLARLVGSAPCAAVAGTAGKSTVTGMAGYILEQAGLNPTVANGGVVVNWQAMDRVGNVRLGHPGVWVVEADESDRSLLRFAPEIALITNVSKDHFSLDEVTDLFRQFAAQVSGTVLLGESAARALQIPGAQLVEGEVVRIRHGYVVHFDGQEILVPLIGRHNAENAVAALNLCREWGVETTVAATALQRFRGIGRRLEQLGSCNEAPVIDDYGHNPAKLAAAWGAVAERADRVLGSWRPHGFGPLRLLMDELVQAFSSVCRERDILYLLPVFYAGGTAAGDVKTEDLVEKLCAAGVNARFVPDYPALESAYRSELGPGDAALIMGARDPGLPRFARTLADSST